MELSWMELFERSHDGIQSFHPFFLEILGLVAVRGLEEVRVSEAAGWGRVEGLQTWEPCKTKR